MTSCSHKGPGPYGRATATGYVGHDVTLKRGPAYSIGTKSKPSPGLITPGPYTVRGVSNHGRYPYQGCTIGVKPNDRKINATAGPADYFPKYHNKPGITIGSKWKNPHPMVSPGPAAYHHNPEKPHGFTMGMKNPGPNPQVTPGPYNLVNVNIYKTKPPAVRFAGKGVGISAATPGPGPAIHMPKESKGPAYSFGLKHHECSPPMITAADNNY